MKIKKLSGLLLAGMLAVSMGTCAFADDVQTPATYTIQIDKVENDTATHIYEAYQVFTGVVETKDGKTFLNNIGWGTGVDAEKLVAALKADATVGSKFAKAKADAAETVAAAMSEMTADEAEAVADIIGANLGAVTKTSTGDKIEGLSAGYYFVKDKDKSLVDEKSAAYTKYILRVVENVKVEEKSDVPDIDKKIDGDTDTDGKTEGEVFTNTAKVGDKVPYIVKSKVPDMSKYEKYYFIVSDKMTKGLTFNNDVEITVGTKKLVKDTDYTVTFKVDETSKETNIEIVFKNFIQYETSQKGKDIEVRYSATLNQDAERGTTSEGVIKSNDNDVKLTYSNNPNKKGEGTDKPNENEKDVTGETPWKEVKTYTVGLRLTKVNEEGDKLRGAKFGITGDKIELAATIINEKIFVEHTGEGKGEYYRLKNGEYTKEAPKPETEKNYDTDGADADKTYDLVEKVTNETKKADVAQSGWVDENGVITFDGLGKGVYEIKELVSPEGYNLLKDPVKVTIDYTLSDDKKTITGWTVTDQNDVPLGLDAGEAHNYYDMKIINHRGSFLPSTGGMGTTILYIVALAVGVISFVGRKVMKRSAAK